MNTVASVFASYVRLRKQGWSMEETVAKLQEYAQQLPRDERYRLGETVMEWEEKFGKDPRLSPSFEPTLARQTVQVEHAAPRQNPPSPAIMRQPPNAFGTRVFDPSKLPAALQQAIPAAPVSCPHCGKPNPAESSVCRGCGQLISAKPASPTRRLDDSIAKRIAMQSEFFPPDSALLISIRGLKNALESFPRNKMLIGRGYSPVNGQPFLDLTPYDGEALGVSRYHAEVRQMNNTLVLVDLDSDNGTYINEMRVFPYEVRVLRNNDELRFGKLIMRIAFRVPNRR
jgi:hypothetical protein